MKLLALTALLFIACTPVMAQTSQCAKRADLMKQFEARYKEKPIAQGLARNGVMMGVFATEDRSAWTVIATAPSGISCIATDGVAWEVLDPKYGAEG